MSIRTKKLDVTNGFHSEYTEPLLPHLADLALSLTWNPPVIRLESTEELQSNVAPDHNSIPEHTRRPVFFHQAIQRLVAQFPNCTWLEAGRGSSVMQLVKRSVGNVEGHAFHSPQLASSTRAQDSLTDVTVELWRQGYAVQYWPFHRSQRGSYEHLSLPPIQFEKTRHWLPYKRRNIPEQDEPLAAPTSETHELLTFIGFRDAAKTETDFDIDPKSERFKEMLGGHVMAGETLAPASLYYEVAARAALLIQKDTEAKIFVPSVEDLLMKSPIGQCETKKIALTLRREPDEQSCWSFSITTRDKTSDAALPTTHSTGKVRLEKRSVKSLAKEFGRYETLTINRRYDEVLNHHDAEKMSGRHIYVRSRHQQLTSNTKLTFLARLQRRRDLR